MFDFDFDFPEWELVVSRSGGTRGRVGVEQPLAQWLCTLLSYRAIILILHGGKDPFVESRPLLVILCVFLLSERCGPS